MTTTTQAIGIEALKPAARKSMYLSHFTPSMMPVETLEQLLVKRGSLVDRIVKSVVESVKTKGLHHHLFVGPRGIGKTHLISLVFHRLSANKTIQSKGKVVWMREEEWGVTSFFELVVRIMRNIDQSEPSLGLKEKMDELHDLKTTQLEDVASQMLLDIVKDKTLVILLENLDDLFEQMGDSGQQKWRAFIQNNPQFVMIATTPALFKGVTSQKAAFYGSFDVEALDELSFDEVVELLEKIAHYRGDQELVEYIKTPEGRARIRAVHHLAEGNPRIYIIFAQFLSKVALDELVQAFMHTLDELTPYYQARMKERSGQQRKILDFLVKYRGAAPVKDIAKACFISQQVCSAQLKVLKDVRFVRAEERGRMSYYELREPLMRLCMEVKQQRGEPLSLFVDILRIWHSQDELEGMLSSLVPQESTYKRYVEAAFIKSKNENDDPKLLGILNDLQKNVKDKTVSELWPICEELVTLYPDMLSQLGYAMTCLIAVVLINDAKNRKLSQNKLQAVLSQIDLEKIFTDPVLSNNVQTISALLLISEKLFNLNNIAFQSYTEELFKKVSDFPSELSVALVLLINKSGAKRARVWLDQVVKVVNLQLKNKLTQVYFWVTKIIEAILSGDETTYLALPKEIRKIISPTNLDEYFKLAKTKRLTK